MTEETILFDTLGLTIPDIVKTYPFDVQREIFEYFKLFSESFTG
jgi:hypothetical protein